MCSVIIILSIMHAAGIYLMYNEFCLPDNAQISRMLVKNAPIKCGFTINTQVGGGGGGGESVWTGPEGAVNSSLSQSGINLQLSSTSNVGNYTCTHSGVNITVLITSKLIFHYSLVPSPSSLELITDTASDFDQRVEGGTTLPLCVCVCDPVCY